MSDKIEITLCLGSSCFARGNKKTLQTIQDYIAQNNLEDIIFLNGGHCFGMCERGPILKVNKTIYEKVDYLNVIEILAKEIENK